MEYYVIGEREIVLGFALSGVRGTAVTNRAEALDAFRAVTGQVVAPGGETLRPRILILTEDVADMLSSEVDTWQMTGKSPLIVEVPGLGGRQKGRQSLIDSIRGAVGIHF